MWNFVRGLSLTLTYGISPQNNRNRGSGCTRPLYRCAINDISIHKMIFYLRAPVRALVYPGSAHKSWSNYVSPVNASTRNQRELLWPLLAGVIDTGQSRGVGRCSLRLAMSRRETRGEGREWGQNLCERVSVFTRMVINWRNQRPPYACEGERGARRRASRGGAEEFCWSSATARPESSSRHAYSDEPIPPS